MGNNPKKILLINTALLLGVAAIFFRAYLPVTEEISGLNQQLKSLEKQLHTLKAQPVEKSDSDQPKGRQLHALPEGELEHLSQQLAALAVRHNAKLVQVEPDKEQAESISKLKLKLIPYEMGFTGKDPRQFSELLAALENDFPELVIQKISYEKEIGIVEAKLLISSQGVRLFTP
jgi:hypothetical protein